MSIELTDLIGALIQDGDITGDEDVLVRNADGTLNKIPLASFSFSGWAFDANSLSRVGGTNPAVSISEVAGSPVEFGDIDANSAHLSKLAESGDATLRLNAIPDNNLGAAYLDCFRTTDTTGFVALRVFRGNGSADVNTTFRGNDSTTLNALLGNVEIGSASNDARLTVRDNVIGSNRETFGGNPTVSLSAEATAYVDELADSTNADYDFNIGIDGVYSDGIRVVLELAGGGDRVGSFAVDYKRVPSTVTLIGSPVQGASGDLTGITVTISSNPVGSGLRINIANDTGDTVSGHIQRGAVRSDLVS